jgi:isopenicillin-N epimerase
MIGKRLKSNVEHLPGAPRERVYKIIKTEPLCPNTNEWLGQMASVEIDVNDSQELKKTLLEKYKIEIPIFQWQDKTLLRFSFNAYNDQSDADILINALEEIF